MPGHACFHCKQWIEAGAEHDCWTTTEHALTKDLSEDLRDAYDRVREAAVELGEQRIYASHHSIMFSRKACHFFVRPKRSALELWIFLGRTMKSPLVKKTMSSSRTKVAHLIHIIHRDQVEEPITDWMREAYGLQDVMRRAHGEAKGTKTRKTARTKTARPRRKLPA